MRGGGSIVEALRQAIGGMEAAAQIQASLAIAYWPRVVGEQAALASQAETVRDGVLFVRTKSSVWSHELNLHKPRILLNLNRLLGGNVIQEVVFRAQGVTPPPDAPPPDVPPPAELAAVVLDPDEKAELRARLERLFSIRDEHARRALAARLNSEAKLRRWRLEHGWRACPSCTGLHRTDFPLCPVCRLCR